MLFRNGLIAGLALGLACAAAAPGGLARAHDGKPHAKAAAAAQNPFSQKAAIQASRAAVGRKLGDYAFRDRRGRRVRLSEFRGRPLVVSMIYTSCAHTCPALTNRVAITAEAAHDLLGRNGFTVVTVGFDARNDTPARMRAYAHARGLAGANWKFLSSDAATVKRLAADLGFTYFRSAAGFDHIAQTTIVDAQGRVYRHIYGSRFAAPMLVEPLKDLVLGIRAKQSGVAAALERIRLFCTVYDPRTGRYRVDFSLIVAAAVGALCLGGTAFVLVRAWLRTGGSDGMARR